MSTTPGPKILKMHKKRLSCFRDRKRFDAKISRVDQGRDLLVKNMRIYYEKDLLKDLSFLVR